MFMLNNFHWHCHAHRPTRPRPGLHCPYTQSASRPSRKFCSAPSGEKFCILIRPAMPALIKCQQIKGELALPLLPAFPAPLPPAHCSPLPAPAWLPPSAAWPNPMLNCRRISDWCLSVRNPFIIWAQWAWQCMYMCVCVCVCNNYGAC